RRHPARDPCARRAPAGTVPRWTRRCGPRPAADRLAHAAAGRAARELSRVRPRRRRGRRAPPRGAAGHRRSARQANPFRLRRLPRRGLRRSAHRPDASGARMSALPDRYDLAIVGGGINGAGIARDAAGRGLKVLVCEQGDLAAATSAWSSKLIHGGLRYLEQYEFRLVAESLAEREILLRIAPHLVRP